MDNATEALLTADLVLAERVISVDDEIARLCLSCEGTSLHLLARQAPVAGDLRQVVSDFHIVAEVHRMGELAVHIAERARRRHPDHCAA